jgi:Tol biopolymer transport system component/DNA-binding winged helix-turn-helix (wHTH) protein
VQPCPDREQIARFGPFEIDVQARILRKNGLRVRLASQPFEVLTALVENAGTVITREELRGRIWPENRFVDFEHGLNAAVTRLRLALGDSAARPRYIETVPRTGYRFIAEVQRSATVATDSPGASVEAIGTPPKPARRSALAFLPVAAVVLVVFGVLLARNRSEQPVRAPHPRPLTGLRGQESSPALSPDSTSVAFSWDAGGNFDIYLMALGSDAPVRLTADEAHDLAPAWSPDGRSLAFLRTTGTETASLIVIPASGGQEQVLAEIRNLDLRRFPFGMRVSALSWSADGRWIAASHRAPGAITEGIYLFSLTGERRQITFPPLHSHGDHGPAFSPDGHALVFCRLEGFNTSEIYLLRLDEHLNPIGKPQALTRHLRWAVNPLWTSDGTAVLYVFGEVPNARSPREVRLIDILNSRPAERTIPFDANVGRISLGAHLVYSQERVDTDIWRAPIPPPGEPPAVPERFVDSTVSEYGARYSPDGRKIAFVSMRSGLPEIWNANADGSGMTRLTHLLQAAPLNPPAWSPDGRQLLFCGRNGAFLNLLVMPSEGGTPRPLTNSAFDENMPTYSRDGRWIYFNSMRSGRRQVWKMPAAGGEAVQITTGGGLRPLESPDGKWIYYVAESGGTIRQVPTDGGKETDVVSCVHPTAYGFAVTEQGIYYRDCSESAKQHIRLFRFATRRSRLIAEANEMPFGTSLTVSPDEKHLLFDQATPMDADLILLENFRIN